MFTVFCLEYESMTYVEVANFATLEQANGFVESIKNAPHEDVDTSECLVF